jgi:hypothetical protein
MMLSVMLHINDCNKTEIDSSSIKAKLGYLYLEVCTVCPWILSPGVQAPGDGQYPWTDIAGSSLDTI